MKEQVDRLTPERRSWLMSRVASKNTAAEIRVRRVAHACGLRFRLHRRDLPGTPDLIFPGRRIAVFVHGCFWHRHADCRKSTNPRSHTEYWTKKFDVNVARDREAVAALEACGWNVHVIWECETKDPKILLQRLTEIFAI